MGRRSTQARLLVGAMAALCALALHGSVSAAGGGVVTAISPDGLNLRSSPNTQAQVLAVIPAGTLLTLAGESTPDSWYPVVYGAVSGWAFGAFLAAGQLQPAQMASAQPLAAAPASAPNSIGSSGATTAAGASNGAPQLAASPSAPALAGSPPTAQVTAAQNATAPNAIAPASVVGGSPPTAVNSAASVLTSAASGTGAPSSQSPMTMFASQGQGNPLGASLSLPLPSFLGGGTATLTMTVNTDALNLRAAPDSGSKVLTTFPKGTYVQVIGGAINNWLPVNLNGVAGWMDSTYLAAAVNLSNSLSAGPLNSATTLTAAAFGNPTLGTGAGMEAGLAVAVLPPIQPASFIWPVKERRITTSFKSVHQAIDIDEFPGGGNPALSAADGIVTYSGGEACCSYGLYVIIQHRNGFSSLYSHLSKLEVQQGQLVRQGQEIGLTGNTGNSTGPHLHFALYYNGLPFDPLSVLPQGADVWPGS